jgi:hypothetical protein
MTEPDESAEARALVTRILGLLEEMPRPPARTRRADEQAGDARRRSTRVAVLLPSAFAAFVIVLVLVAVVLEGPETFSDAGHGLGRLVLLAAGLPWIVGFVLAVGHFLDLPPRGPDLPHPLVDMFLECATVASPFIQWLHSVCGGRGHRPGHRAVAEALRGEATMTCGGSPARSGAAEAGGGPSMNCDPGTIGTSAKVYLDYAAGAFSFVRQASRLTG